MENTPRAAPHTVRQIALVRQRARDARVAGALWGLSVHDEIAEVIGASGGTDALIAAAKAHPMDAEVQASTAGAMRNLSVSDENKHAMGRRHRREAPG